MRHVHVCLFSVPSYTDRILWKPCPEIGLLEYGSVDAIKTSDHRPVFATFQVKVTQRDDNAEGKLKKFVMGTNFGSRACAIQ